MNETVQRVLRLRSYLIAQGNDQSPAERTACRNGTFLRSHLFLSHTTLAILVQVDPATLCLLLRVLPTHLPVRSVFSTRHGSQRRQRPGSPPGLPQGCGEAKARHSQVSNTKTQHPLLSPSQALCTERMRCKACCRWCSRCSVRFDVPCSVRRTCSRAMPHHTSCTTFRIHSSCSPLNSLCLHFSSQVVSSVWWPGRQLQGCGGPNSVAP